MTRSEKKIGRVCLVGAGPGDPGLITVAALERLRRAEVVVFDALANPVLLDEAPAQAVRIDVGKRAGQHKLEQDDINRLLLREAREGRFVVRLKGGDPYLFGRGAEEAAYLGRHGIDVEVVPGVTSGIAGPAMAGIPVTHRDHASTVTFVTGHEDPTKGATTIDYQGVASLVSRGGTACVYMGVGRLSAIVQELVRYGLSGQTPAAAVQWGTLPQQRQVRATLSSIADTVAAEGLGPPAIVVIGAVAGVVEPGLDFFIRRPLFGQTVLVTRTRSQASSLRQRLESAGAAVIEAPTIRIVPPSTWEAMDEAVLRMADFDWLVLTSANAVHALRERLDILGLDARHLAGVRVAAVGNATADTLGSRLALKPDLVPERSVAESLAAELVAGQVIQGMRVLLLRADIASPALPEALIRAGADVTQIDAYSTRTPEGLPASAVEGLGSGRINWVTFTSASTARNFIALLGGERVPLASVRTASIGPATTAAMRELGLNPTVEAAEPSLDALVEAMVAAGRADPGFAREKPRG